MYCHTKYIYDHLFYSWYVLIILHEKMHYSTLIQPQSSLTYYTSFYFSKFKHKFHVFYYLTSVITNTISFTFAFLQIYSYKYVFYIFIVFCKGEISFTTPV